MLRLLLPLLFVCITTPTLHATPDRALAESVVRVNSTNQPFNYAEPWAKRAPFTRRGVGVVLSNSRVLVTSDLLPDFNYIEIEEPRSGRKTPAEVVAVDYRAGLALLTPATPGFLDAFQPVTINTETTVGDVVQILQLEGNGLPVLTDGLVTAVQVAPYAYEDSANLVYRVNAPLLAQDGSNTVPLFRNQSLIGLLLRYDQRNQSLEAIPAPVIVRFLDETANGTYRGFGQVGIVLSNLRDPQLRRFVNLSDDLDGVYISDLRPGGPAEQAGVQPGDVLLAVNDFNVDRDGNFEHPLHGNLALSYLLSTELGVGTTADFHLLRDGKPIVLPITIAARDDREQIIPSLSINEPPQYKMVGGLIFQPLTRRLLTEWGGNWRQRAPLRWVYYDAFQDQLFGDDERRAVILLTRVLPDESNLGYENLRMLEVTRVNDRPILDFDSLQEAFQSPIDGFHKIEFAQSPHIIYLDAPLVEQRDPVIRETYGLPSGD